MKTEDANVWWFMFYLSLGLNYCDIEYAEYMRTHDIPPEEAAQAMKQYTENPFY